MTKPENRARKTINFKTLFIKFVYVFAIVLVTVALVTFLWNLIGHGTSSVDWETAFRFASLFGLLLTWRKWRDAQQ